MDLELASLLLIVVMNNTSAYTITPSIIIHVLCALPRSIVNVVGVLPVVNEDMGILHATYQFKSLKDWGEKVDEIGMSDAFQAIVTKANELGTLESSMGYMSI